MQASSIVSSDPCRSVTELRTVSSVRFCPEMSRRKMEIPVVVGQARTAAQRSLGAKCSSYSMVIGADARTVWCCVPTISGKRSQGRRPTSASRLAPVSVSAIGLAYVAHIAWSRATKPSGICSTVSAAMSRTRVRSAISFLRFCVSAAESAVLTAADEGAGVPEVSADAPDSVRGVSRSVVRIGTAGRVRVRFSRM